MERERLLCDHKSKSYALPERLTRDESVRESSIECRTAMILKDVELMRSHRHDRTYFALSYPGSDPARAAPSTQRKTKHLTTHFFLLKALISRDNHSFKFVGN